MDTTEQKPLIQYPFFEIHGTLKITENNECDFEIDPTIQIPEDENLQPFIGEFVLEGTNDTYRRLDLFAYDNQLTQERFNAAIDAKAEKANDYIMEVDDITFVRKDLLN